MPAGELILSGQPVFDLSPGDSKGSGVFAARELWIGRKDSRPFESSKSGRRASTPGPDSAPRETAPAVRVRPADLRNHFTTTAAVGMRVIQRSHPSRHLAWVLYVDDIIVYTSGFPPRPRPSRVYGKCPVR